MIQSGICGKRLAALMLSSCQRCSSIFPFPLIAKSVVSRFEMSYNVNSPEAYRVNLGGGYA